MSLHRKIREAHEPVGLNNECDDAGSLIFRLARLLGTARDEKRPEAARRTSHIFVLSGLVEGLDEKALEAVKTWRFKPATKDGKPVATQLVVGVDFHLY